TLAAPTLSKYLFDIVDPSHSDPHDVSSGSHYNGAVVVDDLIVFVPHLRPRVMMIDTSSDVVSSVDITDLVSDKVGGLRYCAGVLGNNGVVYFIPENSNDIGRFAPSAQSFSEIDISDKIDIADKFSGGVLANDGHIYLIPRKADGIGILDPATDSFSLFDIYSYGLQGNKFAGGVLAPNGHIIMVPRREVRIGDFDPTTQSFSLISMPSPLNDPAFDWKFSGGVLAPNSGLIYFVPFNSDQIGEFDPESGAFQTIDISATIDSGRKYNGGVLAANGHIIMMPSNADNIGDFDPQTGTLSTIEFCRETDSSGVCYAFPSGVETSAGIGALFERCHGGVRGPDGDIYMVPHSIDWIPKLSLSLCTTCEAGRYKAESGNGACVDCPLESDANAGSTACECGTGRVWSSGACGCDLGYSLVADVCTMCEAGKYKAVSGNGECSDCPAGSHAPAGSDACV
ncbi:MAG: hypothetical protein ACPIOQ_50340, partial [Promethearchaeia archaeon]